MQQIGFVVFPGFQVMGFTAVTVFEVANMAIGETFYEVTLLSEKGGMVRSSAGINVETETFSDRVFDTIFVGTGTKLSPTSPRLTEFVRHAMKTSRRIVAPCVGAFSLAEAGVLDGRRASTHWYFAQDLQARFPKVKVEQDRIYVIDGPVWTSAGMTATIDLALAMVERDLGLEVARSVARKLVVYHRRAGGQSQFSTLLELEPKSDRIQRALTYARNNLRNELSVEELAGVANLSPRQFSRAFRAETAQSPAKAIENLRVEAARVLMEQGRQSMDEIAHEAGFDDRERMRRAFLRVLGQPPQLIRRHARTAAQEQELA
jgi:transcriptional regulator GlxA family with amidase domain